ncbi:hypothetical protein, partial [Acidihalobacter prosperus]
MTASSPHLEATSDATIRAHRFGAIDLFPSHAGIKLGQRNDRLESCCLFNNLNRVNHRLASFLRDIGHASRLTQHAFF